MRRRRLYAMGLVTGSLLLAACQEKDPVATPRLDELQSRVDELQSKLAQYPHLEKLDAYLTDQYVWETKVFDAMCQIEAKVQGLDPAKKICAGGPAGTDPPPKYPPP